MVVEIKIRELYLNKKDGIIKFFILEFSCCFIKNKLRKIIIITGGKMNLLCLSDLHLAHADVVMLIQKQKLSPLLSYWKNIVGNESFDAVAGQTYGFVIELKK